MTRCADIFLIKVIRLSLGWIFNDHFCRTQCLIDESEANLADCQTPSRAPSYKAGPLGADKVASRPRPTAAAPWCNSDLDLDLDPEGYFCFVFDWRAGKFVPRGNRSEQCYVRRQ
jgi:hypothetical protein